MNMIRVSRWDPLRDLFGSSERLQRWLGDWSASPALEGVGGWLPPVDVVEESDRLIFRAEIPGVSRDDIDVNVVDGTLVLRGEKKQEKEIGDETSHRVERYFGSFSRSFVLPTSIAADRISARYRDGVLEVILPKSDEAKPRKIKVLTD